MNIALALLFLLILGLISWLRSQIVELQEKVHSLEGEIQFHKYHGMWEDNYQGVVGLMKGFRDDKEK